MQSVIRSIFVLFLLGFFTVASTQLPPEIMVDKHLIEADLLHAAEDYSGAFKVMEKIIALKKEHSLTLPDEFHFKYARVALSADSIKIALESVNKYLSATGREGEFYKEALALLIEAEGTQISAEETCVGKPLGSSCWMALADRPECYFWNPNLQKDETATWSGKCSGNMAQGEGTLTIEYTWGTRYNSSTREHDPAKQVLTATGAFQKGKMQGQWVERDDYWVHEGPYKDGKKHGQWVSRHSRGHVYEGPYKDGKKHGQWVDRYSGGGGVEASYVDGKKHGQWVMRSWSGAVMKGSYVDDKEHGEFYGETELCSSDDSSVKVTVRGKYVDGKKQGYWQNDPYDSRLSVGSGRYDEDGLKQGTWTYRGANCRNPGVAGRYKGDSTWDSRYKGDYIDGKKDGTWLLYLFPIDDWYDGKCLSTRYHQGKEIEEKKLNMKICRQAEW